MSETTGLRLLAEHIQEVQYAFLDFINELQVRAINHDQSKYSDAERPLLENKEYLGTLIYNSPEYYQALEKVKGAVNNHYFHNDHHPEHFDLGIKDMNIFQLIDMLIDWKVASEANGNNIFQSLEINKERYDIPIDIYFLLKNTAFYLGWDI